MSTDETERQAPETRAEAADELETEPLTESDEEPTWLRVRRSSLVRVDKIVHVGVQRRDGDYFVEIRADREIHLPVPSRAAALEALEAIQAGASDISQWTVPRSYMEE